MPVTRFACLLRRRTMRPVALGPIALAAIVLLTAACDRQKAPDPQPKAAASGAAAATNAAGGATASLPGSAAVVRYRVDLSNAGSAMPDDVVRNADDAATRLTSLIGKPVVVNLWATWCAPCVEELPTLDRLAGRVGGAGHVVILSQDLGDDSSVMREFLADRGVGNVDAWHDPENAVGLRFGGQLPTTLVYDAAGREVGRVIGPMDWTGADARALLNRAGFGL